METPETEGFPPEEQDQEETGADSAEDASRTDEDTEVAPEGVVDEENEDRGDV